MLRIITVIAAILVLLAAVVILMMSSRPDADPNEMSGANEPVLINQSNYLCRDNKSIDVSYYETEATTTIPQGPMLDGLAEVSLSDGRQYTIRQTVSADGVRYATASEDFVFWSKGNGALVLENNTEKSYIGCVLVAPEEVGLALPEAYVDQSGSFSIRLPKLLGPTEPGYAIDEDFAYALSPEESISGVKFTIPANLATGTNLSADSYLSVETIPNSITCTADLFLPQATATSTQTDDGTTYSVATSSEAAAGNRYQEKVFALSDTNPCMAVRYFVHYTVLENYEPGIVKEFDAAGLIMEFDRIRKTLMINQ